MNRRTFIKTTGSAAMGAVVAGRSVRASATSRPVEVVPCLFTKALHHVPIRALPGVLNELGIDAVDLTCRPGGHVLPEQAESALPAACRALRAAGVAVPMLTTGIVSAEDAHAEGIIRTAAAEGIRYIKLGYYPYDDLNQLPETLAEVTEKLRGVAALCRRYGLTAGIHNHSGYVVGAAMWDVWQLLEAVDSPSLGSYYDFMHATVEGGYGGWMIGLYRLRPRLVMAAVKDYQWRQDGQGRWRPECVPLGTGMVNLEQGLGKLKEFQFAGPLSLHIEYGAPMPELGSQEDLRKRQAIRRDWSLLRNAGRVAGLFPR